MTAAFRSTRPAPDEYLDYYGTYIREVPDGDIVDTLSRQIAETVAFLRSIPESRGDYRYAPGKWSIREVIGHVCDGERVFCYRAMRFARADETPLPGFEENSYVANGPFSHMSLADLISEFEHVRRSNIYFFAALDEEALSRRGTANGNAVSVRALAFILAGHETHHMNFLRSHYLDNARQVTEKS
jgi:uncharacterized damage-inducible protein DinB